jgi:hypothetical protein
VLGESGIEAKERQVDVERKINNVLQTSPTSFVVSHVFKNLGEFKDWWHGRLKYSDIREARNQITHDYCYFDGNILKVKDRRAATVLNWTAEQVFGFAESVLAKAIEISTMWALGVEDEEIITSTYPNSNH